MKIKVNGKVLKVHNTVHKGYGPAHTYNTEDGSVEQDVMAPLTWWWITKAGVVRRVDAPEVVEIP